MIHDHPFLILVLGTGTIFVVVVTALLAQWAYLDHCARRHYELRVHTREHAFTPKPGCRFCSGRPGA